MEEYPHQQQQQPACSVGNSLSEVREDGHLFSEIPALSLMRLLIEQDQFSTAKYRRYKRTNDKEGKINDLDCCFNKQKPIRVAVISLSAEVWMLLLIQMRLNQLMVLDFQLSYSLIFFFFNFA